MKTTRVLALLPLFVVLAHSFSWDFVVGIEKRLEFYSKGTVIHTEDIPSIHRINTIKYDPVHYTVLFGDYHIKTFSIHSFDLTTRKIQTLVRKQSSATYKSLAYDPPTHTLFWTEDKKIYSLSLKPASSNVAVDGNLIVTTDRNIGDITVDSCGGYIYWATSNNIERAAFDGSERKVLINSKVASRRSLSIDYQTQLMYWVEVQNVFEQSIESADLNGRDSATIYGMLGVEDCPTTLTVSKDYIYLRSYCQRAILQLPKKQQRNVTPIIYLRTNTSCWPAAANYTIEEQTLGIKCCEPLKNLMLDVKERHGSICHNYCFRGNCSISAKGHPKCSCKAGYSGERCEVNACYKHCLNNGFCSLNEAEKPVCHCTADYQGERCDDSICKDYCLKGNCFVSTERQRICRCNAGYSGERCEVNACHKHCLNNGVCSLNEEDEPFCQCTADYEGERCDVAIRHTDSCDCADKMAQQILRNLRGELKQCIREELKFDL